MIMLESNHVDVDAVRNRLLGTQRDENLADERKALRSLKELSKIEYSQREEEEPKLNTKIRTKNKLKVRVGLVSWKFRRGAAEAAERDLAEFELAYREMDLILENREDTNKRYWTFEDDKKESTITREEYIHEKKLRNATVSLATIIFIIASFTFLPALNFGGEKAFGSFFAIMGMSTAMYILYSLIMSHKFFDKSHAYKSKLLSESFGPIISNSINSNIQHLDYLGLGQFFQTKSHLYRFMGFVEGPNHALFLRKSMKGSSELVEEFVDRFSAPALVALTVSEFCDIYSGQELEKSDHWWSSRIISPSENWN